MPPSVLDKDLAISKGLHPVSLMKTPVDLVRNNGDNQIIHTSEASSTSQIYTPFIQGFFSYVVCNIYTLF